MEKAVTIAISTLDLKTLEGDGVKTEAITLPFVETPIDYPKFKWINSGKEDTQENKDAYLNYVCDILKEFKSIQVELAPRNLLDCDSGLPHHLRGTTDLIAYPLNAALCKRNNLAMVFELKPNLFVDNNIAQTIGEVIAANALSHTDGSYPSPVGVLTDLMDQWCLIWISKNGTISYASTMSSNEDVANLDRKTALFYIKKHIELCNKLVIAKFSRKRKLNLDETFRENINLAFGEFNSSYWKRGLEVVPSENMEDFYDTMDDRDIERHRLNSALRIFSNSNLFPPAAESSECYLSMYC